MRQLSMSAASRPIGQAASSTAPGPSSNRLGPVRRRESRHALGAPPRAWRALVGFLGLTGEPHAALVADQRGPSGQLGQVFERRQIVRCGTTHGRRRLQRSADGSRPK